MRRTPRAELKGITYMTRMELIQAVSGICEKLSKTLPNEEYAAGWTETSRTFFLEFFRKLESDLRSGVDIPYIPIGRNLDHSGIGGGELLEAACRISVALNERKW